MTHGFTNLYAVDGKCHNSEAGHYNQECEKPAEWIGVSPNGFASGFCGHCKAHGREAKSKTQWINLNVA